MCGLYCVSSNQYLLCYHGYMYIIATNKGITFENPQFTSLG
jgi:hypothetical protein